MKIRINEKFKSPVITAPLLVIFVIFAMHISRSALANIQDQSNMLMAVGVIQLAAFGLPCIVYYLLKGRKLSEPIYGIPKRGPQVLFTIFSALFFVSGTLLLKYFYILADKADAAIVNYYGDFSVNVEGINHFEIILSFIIIPAVCEEMVFRGIIFSEYRTFGTANAILISAICFAMLHFSVQNFFMYLFAGLLFGFVTAITRSVFPSMLLHMLSNTLSIYASDHFLYVTINKNEPYFVGFVLAILTSLTFILMVSRVESICHSYAEKPPMETIPPKSGPNFAKVFFSPTFLILTVIFLISALT